MCAVENISVGRYYNISKSQQFLKNCLQKNYVKKWLYLVDDTVTSQMNIWGIECGRTSIVYTYPTYKLLSLRTLTNVNEILRMIKYFRKYITSYDQKCSNYIDIQYQVVNSQPLNSTNISKIIIKKLLEAYLKHIITSCLK